SAEMLVYGNHTRFRGIAAENFALKAHPQPFDADGFSSEIEVSECSLKGAAKALFIRPRIKRGRQPMARKQWDFQLGDDRDGFARFGSSQTVWVFQHVRMLPVR
ncbi:MAG: hypothetical protein QM771_07190, partial [Nitrospira sp.]